MLSVESIGKQYGELKALNNVSFDLVSGEIVALLGANGSGKTTTVQSICKLVSLDSGDIRFEGQSIKDDSTYLNYVGAVLDGSRNTNWRLTVKQNAEYFARLRGCGASKSHPVIERLEERLGLDKYRGKEVMKLSTGNKQKASLLCALAYSPKLMLLDEPTLGLDLQTVEELQDIIVEQARSSGQGFLITSHDLSFIDQICHRVIVLESGEIVFNGTLSELKSKLYRYEILLSSQAPHLEVLQGVVERELTGKWDMQTTNSALTIQYDEVSQILPILAWLSNQSWYPESLKIEELDIERAYRALTNKEVSQ